jgi:fumarylacetoacetate (FAA) hydrolase
MRLATLTNGSPDGELVIVSRDGSRFCTATAIVPNLQTAMETWAAIEGPLRALAVGLEQGGQGDALDPARLIAPMPRAWQWLDGSAYRSHGDLMDQALGIVKPPIDFPLMYQGASDKFYGPNDDVRFPDEELGIDFEGEFGVIVDAVPMGISAADAMKHIRLVVQINDWSLRMLAGPEMKTGFGWVWAKPHCSMAPFAVTPDALGDGWRDGRVCLDLLVDWNGQRFGAANGAPMDYGFHELVARAARTRDLVAGTVIGSGTVSNADYRTVGSSCIAERRGIEIVDSGQPVTAFMRFGDRVRMEGRASDGTAPFGVIDQMVVSG